MTKRIINLDEVEEDNQAEKNQILETVTASLARAAAQQRDLLANAVNTINSSHYLSAVESLNEKVQEIREAFVRAIPKLPEIKVPDFTVQAIRDAQNLLPFDTTPKLIEDVEWMTTLEVNPPANRHDVALLGARLDEVSNGLNNLTEALTTNTDVMIICATCSETLAKVQYMLTGQVKCCRCKKLRNIPSKEVRIVVPSHN